MQITLQQQDIELAVTQYMANNGIRAEVSQIDFSMARKSGNALTATVTMSGSFAGFQAPISAPAPVVATETTHAVVTPEEPAAVETPAVVTPVVAAPVVAEPVVAAAAVFATETPAAPVPFELDDAEEEEAVPATLNFAKPAETAAAVRPTSLFG